MQEVRLVAEPRTEAGKAPARRLRREGMVPAVVYGLGTDTRTVAVPARPMQHILAGGANTLIDLVVDGEPVLTLAREVQRHALRGTLLHVDFVRVNRDVEIHAEIPVSLEGDSPGVRAGGRLNQILFTVTVAAKPGQIPTSFVLDVSALDVGDSLAAGTIALPAGVTLVTDPEETVVAVAATRLGAARAEDGEGEEGGEGEGEGAATGADGDESATDEG
jgi:large subunit ribosomal protein L25